MEANQSIEKQGLKWRCKKHPALPCELICLDGNSKDSALCFLCVQNHQIPLQNLISMSNILLTKDNEILQAYPPLKDQELFSRLRNANLQQNIEEIDIYFKKLREKIEKEIKAAEQRAKQSLIKQERVSQELLEGYMRIAELEKLKDLIVSEKGSAEKDLDDFIKEKWNNAEQNRKVVADLINQYEAEQYFQSEEPNRIAEEIIQSLKSLNFFQQSIQSHVTLIKSTYGTSQSMEITKGDNYCYSIKRQQPNNSSSDQVFIDPILDPLKKYILHIELEQKPGNNNNHFLFGLVKNEGKDNSNASSQNMCYSDKSNDGGITRYIKGSPMQSGSKATGKHSFEVRIYLNEKFLRVASLPDYSSITELDDLNKIDPKVAYRFFLCMLNQGDMMRITKIGTVYKFDEKM